MLNRSTEIKNLKNLGVRVYKDKMILKEENGKVVQNDEDEIIKICNKTFGTNTEPKNPTTNNIELFNEFLVQTVEEIVEPSVKEILGLLADYKSVPSGTVQMLSFPKTTKPKFMYTAKGTGVDLVRLSGSETKKIAVPESLTYGGYYEITTFRADPIKAFREAVDKLAQAKIDLYFELVYNAFRKAVTNGEIPANNCQVGTDLGIAEFQKVEQTMIRLTGGRPLFIGDQALINHFANKVPTEQKDLLTYDLKKMLREELIPTQISKTTCLSFVNYWIDENNSKVKFSADQGFMLPGGMSGKKPFAITEFGATRQYSTLNQETEQIELKIVFETNVTLLNARYIGSIIDDSVTI